MTSRRITGTINHWSASSHMTSVEDIRGWHKAKGWREIGYHRVILHPDLEKEATEWWQLVKLGRSLDSNPYLEETEVGAHTLGYNRTHLGVCTVHGPGLKLHPLQKEAIIRVNLLFAERFKYPVTFIKGHRDMMATACPGPEIYKVIQELRQGKYGGRMN